MMGGGRAHRKPSSRIDDAERVAVARVPWDRCALRPREVKVDLINTDGLAIFGPGSEWFWTMLQFTALTVTFVAIYRQLRVQHLQIRENTKLLRSQAHYNATWLSQRPWEMLMDNEGLAAVVTAGYAAPEQLNPTDRARWSSFVFMQLDAWEYLYYQHRDDSIPNELWVGADAYYRDLVATKPGLTHFWSESERAFDEPFRSYVAGEVAKRPSPPEPR
jgi:hypothetical protein